MPLVATVGTTMSSNVGASNDFSPSCQSNNGADQVFTITFEMDGLYCIDTYGSALSDTVLAVYDGCGENATELLCNDDGIGGALRSRVELDAAMGTPYTIVVDGYNTREGDFDLNIVAGACP